MCQSLSKRTVLHVTHNGLDLLLSLQEQLLRFVIKNFLVDHNGLHTSLKSFSSLPQAAQKKQNSTLYRILLSTAQI